MTTAAAAVTAEPLPAQREPHLPHHAHIPVTPSDTGLYADLQQVAEIVAEQGDLVAAHTARLILRIDVDTITQLRAYAGRLRTLVEADGDSWRADVLISPRTRISLVCRGDS